MTGHASHWCRRNKAKLILINQNCVLFNGLGTFKACTRRDRTDPSHRRHHWEFVENFGFSKRQSIHVFEVYTWTAYLSKSTPGLIPVPLASDNTAFGPIQEANPPSSRFPWLDIAWPTIWHCSEVSLVLPLLCWINLTDIKVSHKGGRYFWYF